MKNLGIALIALTFAGAAVAGPGDRGARRSVRDDVRDVKTLERLLVRHDRADAVGNLRQLRRIDEELRRWMQAELRETRQELRKDERKLQRTRRDMRARRASTRAVAHRRAEAREERRDLVRLRRLSDRLERLEGRVDRRSARERRNVMRTLLGMAEDELFDVKAEPARYDRRGGRR